MSDKGNRFHHSVIRQRRSPELGEEGPAPVTPVPAGGGHAEAGAAGAEKGGERRSREEGWEPGIKTTLRNETRR